MNCLEDRLLAGDRVQMERDGEIIHVYVKYNVFIIERKGYGLLCEQNFDSLSWILKEFKEMEEVKWN